MGKPRDISNKTKNWHPGLGHNRTEIPPEELQAELAALREAEARTEASNLAIPELVEYLYEVRFYPGSQLTTGEIEAYDQNHARRLLHVILGLTKLPVDTRIVEKYLAEEEQNERNAARNRRLLVSLTDHHQWLQGGGDGTRADLSGDNLSAVNLEGRDLSHVSLANAKLSGARLKGAKLVGADLTGADLSGADLTECNLENASLAEANLIGANLTRANVKRADFWRANLARSVVSPELLHQALGCEASPRTAVSKSKK